MTHETVWYAVYAAVWLVQMFPGFTLPLGGIYAPLRSPAGDLPLQATTLPTPSPGAPQGATEGV